MGALKYLLVEAYSCLGNKNVEKVEHMAKGILHPLPTSRRWDTSDRIQVST